MSLMPPIQQLPCCSPNAPLGQFQRSFVPEAICTFAARRANRCLRCTSEVLHRSGGRPSTLPNVPCGKHRVVKMSASACRGRVRLWTAAADVLGSNELHVVMKLRVNPISYTAGQCVIKAQLNVELFVTTMSIASELFFTLGFMLDNLFFVAFVAWLPNELAWHHPSCFLPQKTKVCFDACNWFPRCRLQKFQ